MSHEIERRVFGVTLRSAGEKDQGTIAGVAALFNSWSENLGGFREIIRPGAFRNCIEESDCRALFNHDPNLILGRTSARTLRLSESDAGLEFEIDMPDTTYARDLAISMARGDVSQCSFAFTVKTDGQEWEEQQDRTWTRTITMVERLYDVSPVTYPAYPQTECALRSLATFRESQGREEDIREIDRLWNRLRLAGA